MSKEYIIPACSGIKIDVQQGQSITVVDIEGGQVVDFFAEVTDKPNEFLSTGVTIDCNESLKLKIGDTIYTPEMYDYFYHNGKGHRNCLDNINNALEEQRPIITPINLFMHTKINTDGNISVEKPISEAGDKIILKALLNITLGIAACSVSESQCNSGKCSSVKVIID